MTRLVWDKVEDRTYETGIDHGVLYFPVSGGVAWNGLISIDESLGGDGATPGYFDGVKQRDMQTTGDFEGTLNAFTYPDEFMAFEGYGELGDGSYVDDQQAQVFGLSYRVMIPPTTAYQLHLLYNLTAVSGERSYETLSDSQSPMEFSWALAGVPETAPNYRSTGHIILDSRYLNEDLLNAIEDIIYGTDTTEPRLPRLSDLIDLALSWAPKIISQSTAGPSRGVYILANGVGDLSESNIDGIYFPLPTTRLVETDIDGLNRLVP